jgi:3-methyladenine DNA glycosylase AlkD
MNSRSSGKAVAEAVFREVRAFCESRADAARARKYAKFFVEGYDAYGVDPKDPAWEQNKKAWAGRLRAAEPAAYLDAGDLLVRTGKYEEASFAILIAKQFEDGYTPQVFRRLGQWFDGGIRNWGHTDVMCGEILGGFVSKGIVRLDALEEWRGSSYKFKRRAVPVMLINAVAAGMTVAPLLEFVEPLMHDPEKVVQQGMGWFLREAWKREPKQVEALLKKHKDSAPRLIVQYAAEKMSAAQKQQFKRAR